MADNNTLNYNELERAAARDVRVLIAIDKELLGNKLKAGGEGATRFAALKVDQDNRVLNGAGQIIHFDTFETN